MKGRKGTRTLCALGVICLLMAGCATLREEYWIRENTQPSQPLTVYVHGSAGVYSYTHANHISINVIPVNDARLRELQDKGIGITEIS